jgi:tetratricopeptide (TPR) repeat protein
MGVVFRARSPEGHDVAVKVVLDAMDEQAIASFDREKRLLWSFRLADGFVPIIDAGVENGRPYLVMPLLTGGTLRARVRHGPLPVAEAVSLAITLARAVGRAHDRGIVHRDLKPENVIFTAEGVPLLADLGLAKHFRRDLRGASQSLSFSSSGTIVGSPGYLSPEQVEDSKRLTAAADVFSLVVILYECLSGSRPFPGSGLVEYQTALRSRPRPLREVAPSVPVWLEALCERGLAADPARRWPDGHALARALEAGAPRRRRTFETILGASVLLALGVGLAVHGHGARPRPVAASPPIAPVSSSALGERARARIEAKDWAGAAADFTRLIELDERDARAWIGRAFARSHTGDLAGARADADRAVALAPGDAKVWSDRGMVRAFANDFAGAVADHTRAIELAPWAAFPLMQRGLARTKCGDLAGAEADCRRALELDPTLAGAWAGVSYVQLRRSDFQGALASSTRALELDPTFGDAALVRGTARARLHDPKGALDDLDALVAVEPRSARNWSLRGDVRGELGDWKGAVADYDRAVALEPSAGTLNGRGWSRAHAGDAEGGIADCLRALALTPDDAAIVHSLGWARARKGDDAGAIEAFTRAMALDPKLPDAPRDRGRARERLGDVPGAIADYRLSLDLAPDDPEAPGIRVRLAGLRR